jgi:methionine-rich copper-binding protein CopC
VTRNPHLRRVRTNRPRLARFHPRLEELENRTLLDGAAALTWFNPAALGGGPPAYPIGPYLPGTPPPGPGGNTLVTNPAEDGNSPHDTHSETSIMLDGNTVVSAYNDSLLLDSSGQITGLSRSTDRGATWTDLGHLPLVSGGDAGDPCLAHDSVSGRSYLATLSFSNDNIIPVFRSDDDFSTFLPGSVDAAPGRTSLDKDWMTVDNFPGSGQGNVYFVVRDFGTGNGIFLTRSTDQGNTFGPNGGVSIATGGSVQGAWVTVGPDHAVYVSWYETGRIAMRKSTDQGLTFGPTVTVTTLQTNGINGDLGLTGIRVGTTTPAPFRSNAFAQVVVNPVNNQIYVAYNDKGTGTDKADVFFRQSNDGGATWGSAVRVVDDTTGHDQWMPSLAVSPSGSKVGVFWYDRRLDPANNLIDRFGAIGVVAGSTVTFGPNFRITDTSFAPEFGRDPGIVPTYMGDYDQAAADSGSFYVTWGDNRLASTGHAGQRSDIRFSRIAVDVAGPSVIAINPNGNTLAPVTSLRVTFDESIDPSTAIPGQFSIQDPNGNPVNVSQVTPVAGSDNHQFDVTLDQQVAAGNYAVVIGPQIADMSGHQMDQDGDGGVVGDVDDSFSGRFTIVGPSVSATTLSGRLADQVSDGEVDFNTPIAPASFSADQFVLRRPGGQTVNVTGITALDGTNMRFDVTFDTQTVLGAYTLTIGPNITDAFGNPMSAAYSGGFTLSSERIVNGGFETGDFTGWTQSGDLSFTGVGTGTVHSGTYSAFLGPTGSDGFLAQTFPTTANTTYTLDYWLEHDGGTPSDFYAQINGVTVPGSRLDNPNAFGYTEYTFAFRATGSQTELKFGFLEAPSYFHLDDVSVSPGGIVPRVTSTTLTGTLLPAVDHGRIVFNEQMNPATFTFDQFVLVDPSSNPVTVNSITPVTGTNNTQFDVTFVSQSTVGTYNLTVGPNIMDVDGTPMAAPFMSSFTIASPAVLSTTLTGIFNNQTVDHGRLVFNEPINPSSFTFDQFVLTNPGGSTVNVISITPVSGSNNTQFDVTFDPQNALGQYTLTVGPNITDMFGNPMAAPFVSHFSISNNLIVNGGFENGSTGWDNNNGVSPSGFNGIPAHSGNFFLSLGAVGADAFTNQTVTTVAGQTYNLEFFYYRDGGTPSDLNVYWNNTLVYTETNSAAHGWQQHDISVTGTGHDTLRIGGRNDPTWDGIDDVSLTSTGPGPAPHGGGSGSHGGLGGLTLAPLTVGASGLPGQTLGSGNLAGLTSDRLSDGGVLLPGPDASGGTAGVKHFTAAQQSRWDAESLSIVDQVFADFSAKDS